MDNPTPALRGPDDGVIVILSNRGPHTFVWEDDRWVVRGGTEGIPRMIEPLARQPNVAWFCCVSEPPGSEVERDALYTTAKDQTDPDLNVVPVPLPAALYRDYYQRISNAVLWTVQHHLVGHFSFTSFDETQHRAWDAYVEANRRMADAVVATGLPPRAFILQDYHLYPLAAQLRERFPDTPSLHFLHLPFPDPSVLKLLPIPWRLTILQGLLGADVVGLQTPNDARGFLGCCEELLGATIDYRQRTVILPSGRTVRVRVFPTSIDPQALTALQASPEVAAARERLKSGARDWSIVRVDRLDPSKNQVLGFRAFGRMLDLHPELQTRVRFRAVLIPGRTDLVVYREYRDAVYREAEEINAHFREKCGFDPIEILYSSDPALAVAAMESCDVFVANSRQDGMNLTVKEFAMASRRPGVLLLSDMAGVSREMIQNALPVCPLDVEATARALAEGLAMPHAERATRLESLQSSVRVWTSRDWLVAQLDELGLTLPERTSAPAAVDAVPEPNVLEIELTVLNREGIHARPAALFVRCAREFDCEVDIIKDGETYSARSIMAVLTANLNCGSKFTVRLEGHGTSAAAEKLKALIASFEHEGL